MQLTRTDLDNGRVEDSNQGPPDFKSSTLNHLAAPPPKSLNFTLTCQVASCIYWDQPCELKPVESVLTKLHNIISKYCSDCWSFYFPSGNLVTSSNSTTSFSPNNDSLQMLEIKNIPVILSMSCKDWSLSMASCVRRPNWQASSSSNTTLVSWKPSNLSYCSWEKQITIWYNCDKLRQNVYFELKVKYIHYF